MPEHSGTLTWLRHCANLTAVNQTRRLLSAAQVAGMLGKSTRTIQRMARNGDLPAEQMPGQTGAYLFDAAVIDFLARQQQKEAS